MNGGMMSVLSVDLIANVLVRLSIKDVNQLKVVCKGWNEVLSSVDFCQSYDSYRRPIRDSYILYLDFPSMNFIEFDPILNGRREIILHEISSPTHEAQKFNRPYRQVINSCGGLILVSSDFLKEEFYVYNPATRRSKLLTIPEYDVEQRFNNLKPALAFDPTVSHHYKVVCIVCTSKRMGDEYRYRANIYSSETEEWSTGLLAHQKVEHCSKGVYFGRSVYWETSHGVIRYDIMDNHLESVGSAKEYYHPKTSDSDVESGLQEIEGHLYKCRLHISENKSRSIQLYRMEMDENMLTWWLRVHDDPINRCGCALESRKNWYVILGCMSIEGEIRTVVYHKCRRMILFNHSNKESSSNFERNDTLRDSELEIASELQLYSYQPSLAVVCVPKGKQADSTTPEEEEPVDEAATPVREREARPQRSRNRFGDFVPH